MTAYNFMIEQPSPSNSPKMGSFWLYHKADFSDFPVATNDAIKIMKLKDLWVIRDSYWRVATAGTNGSTYDIGISAASTFADTTHEIKQNAACTAADWTQGTIEPATPTILTADSLIFVEISTGKAWDGTLEVMLEIVAGPQDNEPADMQHED